MSSRSPHVGETFGNDLLQSLERLNEDLLIELSKPVARKMGVRVPRAGSCHASHNRRLLDRRKGEDRR